MAKSKKNAAAVALGLLGGLNGGKAKGAKRLTPEERSGQCTEGCGGAMGYRLRLHGRKLPVATPAAVPAQAVAAVQAA